MEKNEKTIIITEKADLREKHTQYDPYLIQISGRETGQMYNLTGKSVKIGRDANCEIVVDDPHVSRAHAEIEYRSHTDIVIRDIGSTNGVFVNGKKIDEQSLFDGDKVLIGTRLYFKFCYQDAVEQNYQQSLFRAANIDNLTQLYNKKYFMDALSKEFSFSKRNGQPLSLMMIDIDHFKRINDTHGHPCGDLVLKTVGAVLQKKLRLENVAARYGGEEFAIILRNANEETGYQVSERLRKDVEAEKIDYLGKPIQITISIGVATFLAGNFTTLDDLIRSADDNLYQAKARGRNRTIGNKAA